MATKPHAKVYQAGNTVYADSPEVRLTDPAPRRTRWPVVFTGVSRLIFEMDGFSGTLRVELGLEVKMQMIPNIPVRNPNSVLYKQRWYGKSVGVVHFTVDGVSSACGPMPVLVGILDEDRYNVAERFASYCFRSEKAEAEGGPPRLVIIAPGIEAKISRNLGSDDENSVRVEVGGGVFVSAKELVHGAPDGRSEYRFVERTKEQLEAIRRKEKEPATAPAVTAPVQ